MKSYILNSDGRLKNVFLRYCGYINFSAGNYEIIFPLLIGDNVYCELRTKVNALYDLTKTWYDCNIKYYSLDDHAKCSFNPENSHSTMKDFICHINVNMRLNFNLGKAMVNCSYFSHIMSLFDDYYLIDSLDGVSFDLDDFKDRYKIILEQDKSENSISNFYYRAIFNKRPRIIKGSKMHTFIVEMIDLDNKHYSNDKNNLLNDKCFCRCGSVWYTDVDIAELQLNKKYRKAFFDKVISVANLNNNKKDNEFIIFNKAKYLLNKNILCRIIEEVGKAIKKQDELYREKYSLIYYGIGSDYDLVENQDKKTKALY